MSDTVIEETKTETAPAAEGEVQPQLFPDEIKEEEDVREVLINLQPHEVLELVDKIAAKNEELKGHFADQEAEKTRAKEAKDAIAARVETTTEQLSKMIDLAGMRKRKSLERTTKRTNYTTKMVEWILNSDVVDSRPMVAAEYQVKLALAPANPDNVVPIDQAEPAQDGEAQGVDPAEFDQSAPADESADDDAPLDTSEEEVGD